MPEHPITTAARQRVERAVDDRSFDVVASVPRPARPWHLPKGYTPIGIEGIEGVEGNHTPPSAGVNPKDAIGDTKPPLHLVPAALGIYASQAMKNGADKYGPFNWRDKPIQAHVYIAAVQRHLAAWYDGEDIAQDSGVPHLAHAAAGLAILLDAIALGNVVDDRPLPGPAASLIEDFTSKGSPERTPLEQAAWDSYERTAGAR